jgi:hypothetical protein
MDSLTESSEEPAEDWEPLSYFPDRSPAPRWSPLPDLRTLPRRRDRSARPPQALPKARWVPLGEPVALKGLTLPGGLYFGSGLKVLKPYRGIEPALVDPDLSVDLNQSDPRGPWMGYWPYYSQISREARGAYLSWLQAGRVDDVQIGYVFLFFYGIERRVLNDAATSQEARDEVPELLREIERLLELYDHSSFQRYATNFHAAASFGIAKRVADLTPPMRSIVREASLAVKLARRGLAADGKPLPGKWALAWARTDPNISLRTPAMRCHEEFEQLFLARYAARHGEGLKLEPDKRLSPSLRHQPASASFGGRVKLRCAEGLYPVARYGDHLEELRCLVNEVTDELASYSRHIARHGNRDSLHAIARLPDPLARDRVPPALTALLADLPANGHLLQAAAEVAATVTCPTTSKLSRHDATALASLLGALGVGIEPDVRHGGKSFLSHRHVVLWRDEQVAAPVGEDLVAAMALLQMALVMSIGKSDSNGLAEERLFPLTSVFPVSPAGQCRLQARLLWLLAERPGIAGVKALLRHVDETQRLLIARSLSALAAADGAPAVAQKLDTLRWFYGLLELERDPESDLA